MTDVSDWLHPGPWATGSASQLSSVGQPPVAHGPRCHGLTRTEENVSLYPVYCRLDVP